MENVHESWLAVATGASTPCRVGQSAWWQQVLVALRAPVWPVILATLALLGLLLAFQNVVQRAVEQGELRRLAVAEAANAIWRCNTVRDRSERESCHARLTVASGAAAAIHGVGATPMAVVLVSQ